MKNFKQNAQAAIVIGEKFLLLVVGASGLALVLLTGQPRLIKIAALALSSVCLLVGFVPMFVAYIKANLPKNK